MSDSPAAALNGQRKGCNKVVAVASPMFSDERVHFQLEQLSAIEEAFSCFDRNNDGQISLQEFGQLLRSLGEATDEREIREKLQEWDLDGDGNINFAEFIKAITRILTDTDSEERMMAAFRLFDKDNNGYITPEELSTVMTRLGHNMDSKQILEMVLEADLDNDGKISFQEFKKLMSTN